MRKLLCLCLLMFLFACTTKTPQPDVPANHFLGDAYSKLTPIAGQDQAKGWRDPGFDPKQYNAILLDRVVLWNEDAMLADSGLKEQDLQDLADYFEMVLTEAITMSRFPQVHKPGPGVLRITPAITRIEASKPVENAISSVIPIGILVSLGREAATGKGTGVGECSVEVRITDSVSGDVHSMLADDKAGEKYSASGFTATGQAKEAMQQWADVLSKRIHALWGTKE